MTMDGLTPLLHVVDRVIVITLAGAKDRQSRLTQLLRRYGLPFEFHYGADYRGKSTDELAESGIYSPTARMTLGRRPMTAGEIGCAVSHRDVAVRIAQGHDQRVLILEDDACVIEDSIGELEQSTRAMPNDWNLAYFGYAQMNLTTPLSIRVKLWTYYPLAFSVGSVKHDPRAIARIYRRGWGRYWRKAGSFNNSHAYAVDREAATYIAETQKVISMESDVVLNHLVRFSNLSAVCLTRPIFDQDPEVTSMIGDRHSWHD